MSTALRAPTLVFAWGNPSRGDDALGPLFADAVQAWQLPGVECLTDFQLQVEHALDLIDRQRVLFVDAALHHGDIQLPGFAVQRVGPRRDRSFSSHAMSPQAVLQALVDTQPHTPCPPAWLLTLHGHRWGLGDPVSAMANQGLHHALAWAQRWLVSP